MFFFLIFFLLTFLTLVALFPSNNTEYASRLIVLFSFVLCFSICSPESSVFFWRETEQQAWEKWEGRRSERKTKFITVLHRSKFLKVRKQFVWCEWIFIFSISPRHCSPVIVLIKANPDHVGSWVLPDHKIYDSCWNCKIHGSCRIRKSYWTDT